MLILFYLTFFLLFYQFLFHVQPPIVFVLVAAYWCRSLLVFQVLLLWLCMFLCPCDKKYTFGSSFEIYFPSLFQLFLQMFEFSVPCFLLHVGLVLKWCLLDFCWAISMFYLRKLSRQWHPLFEIDKSARLSSVEEKYYCSSAARLVCWKTSWFAFKLCSFRNSL